MTQEQRIKEFVDKWVGKHGFAGIFHNYRKACIQDLTNLLDNWISVEDELPEEKEYVLVYYKSGDYSISCYLKNYKIWAITGYENSRVTHWQPLPQSPKR